MHNLLSTALLPVSEKAPDKRTADNTCERGFRVITDVKLDPNTCQLTYKGGTVQQSFLRQRELQLALHLNQRNHESYVERLHNRRHQT